MFEKSIIIALSIYKISKKVYILFQGVRLCIKKSNYLWIVNVNCPNRRCCEKSSKMYNFSPENVQVILRQKVYKSLGDGFPV